MKRLLPILAFSLALGLVVITAAAAFAGPKMVIPEPLLKMGDVVQGPTIKAEFKIFNKGDQPLVIKNVTPG